jgi:hypothetical protein
MNPIKPKHDKGLLKNEKGKAKPNGWEMMCCLYFVIISLAQLCRES